MQLKPFTYLTLDETKEFLKIPLTEIKHDATIIRLINTACARVEAYIDGPVIVRKITEDRDGNSSNVLVPTYNPIRKVHEIKIDFNRAFDATDALRAENFVLRGIPDLDKIKTELQDGNLAQLFEVRGTDIVIRDDQNTAILGRLFAGSVIQSIRLTYDAGQSYTVEDVPDDIKYATLLIIDHLYMARENRDINVTSKGNMGNQSYSKKTGFPVEAEEMLDEYKDYSLGTDDVPQRNTFVI